jgi:hypothetical protein
VAVFAAKANILGDMFEPTTWYDFSTAFFIAVAFSGKRRH